MASSVGLGRVGHRWAVVLPQAIRQGFVKGETVLVLREGNSIVLRKATDAEKALRVGAQAVLNRSKDSKAIVQKLRTQKKAPARLPKRDAHGHFVSSKRKSGKR